MVTHEDDSIDIPFQATSSGPITIITHNGEVISPEQICALLNIAEEAVDGLIEDGFYGEYSLGEDLWQRFKTAYKAN